MFLFVEVIFVLCAVVCIWNMVRKVNSGGGNTSRPMIHVLQDVRVASPIAPASPASILTRDDDMANVDLDVDELILPNSVELPDIEVFDIFDADNALEYFGTGELANVAAETATSVNLPTSVQTDVVVSDVEGGVSLPEGMSHQPAISVTPRRCSRLSLKTHENTSKASSQGQEEHERQEEREQPRSILKKLLTGRKSLPVRQQVGKNSPVDQNNAAPAPARKMKQVARNSSAGQRNAVPAASRSSVAHPTVVRITSDSDSESEFVVPVRGNAAAATAPMANCSGTARSPRQTNKRPMRIPSDSDSESEFDVFSQEDDRQLMSRFKRRNKEVNEDYSRGMALVRGSEDALVHAEASLRDVNENLRRLNEERQRLEEDRQRAEDEVDACQGRLAGHRADFERAEKKRRLMRLAFNR